VIIVGYSQSARIATTAKRPSSRTTHQKPPNPMRPRLTRWPAGCGTPRATTRKPRRPSRIAPRRRGRRTRAP
jgi:hypothetical protein